MVCDDRSQDGTAGAIRAFADSAPLPVRVVVNETTLGSTKNFEQGIAIAGGDVIALADQDDVWRPDKLARLERIFSATRQTNLIFSDARLVDEHLRPLGSSLWKSLGFSWREQEMVRVGKAWNVLLRHNVAAGATMGFRAELRDACLPIPGEWVHDGWIALIAAASGDVEPIPDMLIDYRQHAGAQIGGGPLGFRQAAGRVFADRRDQHRRAVRQYEIAGERLASLGLLTPERAALLKGKIEHARMRAALPDQRLRRAGPVIGALARGRYARYARGLKDAARDLLQKKVRGNEP